MKIEQIYTGCLAQGAYYITSNGEAAIIDPLRETVPYIDRLKADNVKLKYIFETHFHADFWAKSGRPTSPINKVSPENKAVSFPFSSINK